MSGPISVVLFDLGSTLLYFDGLMPEAMMRANQRLGEALQNLGYRIDPGFVAAFRANFRDYIHQRDVDFLEYTVDQVLRSTLQEFGITDLPADHAKAALREMYAITQAHWKLEEDTLSTLAALKECGCRLGLISNASNGADARTLIAHHRLEGWFEQVLISAEVGYRKPHPRIFAMALDFFGVAPRQALMVGDTLGADILGAKNAGLAAVWITRRARRDDNLAHEDTIRPDAVIQALAELPPLLAGWG